ncbi:cupin domain-containing protein [Nodosilinea sp. LEGE 07298]|uniref:cupin domain-containing protein n=1 Tax=Nodosilinea sp. LEGE 07298 TaxID=2777970 RepID=UPI001D150ABA|nr:cupin domain-containing protein [Nodosilinea sp. LEGE 07298]
MPDTPKIVNMNELEWKEAHHSEHYTGWSKRLTPSMNSRQGHIGVVVERLKPQSLSCPFHYHVHEDEFCLILKGKALLRYGKTTVEVNEGDAISFPRGERMAHQFYNHTNETVDILMMGENLPYDACYYPDSDKWLSRSIPGVGKFEATDYWADEPEIPIMKQAPSAE